MNVVIYARFSSHSQTEQSIEGQLKVCYEYANAHKYTVIGEYIDRAQSGTSDNRTDFQKMIQDSEKHTFQAVLVYQLDRFARNRYDSAINKSKLKKNGVRVLSARENITEDASGILIEGVLESMAEYYSVELSQKINRGMQINASKCLSNGSNPGLGYKVDKDRRFYVDEQEAIIVREIFQRYANGERAADIIRDLNNRRITTSLGREFNKNSINRILRNRRYIGYYFYKGTETPDGMPRILDDALFFKVQEMLAKNRAAPGKSKSKDDYLLTTKLFCGHCGEPMTGYGGTGKLGKKYHYYCCNGVKQKKCDKKIVSKDLIESQVADVCAELLTPKRIRIIAEEVMAACQADGEYLSIKKLKSAIKEADEAIENLWIALEKGQSVERITKRIEQREAEKKKLEKQLAKEKRKQPGLQLSHVLAFLDYLRELPGTSEVKKKSLINIFVRSVLLYDDYFTIIFNAGNTTLHSENIPLKSIESSLKQAAIKTFSGSDFDAFVPPNKVDSFDTFGIETIDLILFAKMLMAQGFSAFWQIGLVSLWVFSGMFSRF